MSRRAGFARWLRQSSVGRGIASRLGAAYIRLVTRSTAWEIQGKETFDDLVATEPGGIIAVIWHGRLFMSPTWAPVDRRPTFAMISLNNDGQVIADIVGRFGIDTVRGSTYDRAKRRDKGGAQAYQAALKSLEQRGVVAMTPDGPRGPRMRAQAGAAQLAISTGCPVIPIAFSARRGRLLRSWDRFLVPWPFGRGVQIYGPVMRPPGPGAADHDAFTRAIEAALTEVTDRADQLCHRPRVAPGPPIKTEQG